MGRPISSRDYRYRARSFVSKGEALQQVHPDLPLASEAADSKQDTGAWGCTAAPGTYLIEIWHAEGEHGEKKINFWEGPTRFSEWKEEQVSIERCKSTIAILFTATMRRDVGSGRHLCILRLHPT